MLYIFILAAREELPAQVGSWHVEDLGEDWWRRDDKKTRTLQPHVGERFALTDANEALAALGSGGTSGKVVIDTTSFNFLGGGGGGGGVWVPGS